MRKKRRSDELIKGERRVPRTEAMTHRNGDSPIFSFFFFFFIISANTVVSVSLLITESENRRLVRITMDVTLSMFVS